MNIRLITFILVTVAATLAVLQLEFHPLSEAVEIPEVRAAPDFEDIDTWFNSEPLKMHDLRGKVVLVDFWTYSCINCLDHLPYVQEWDRTYKDKGLVVVGVHTPEFGFEKSSHNVEQAIKQLKITYGVAQDNNYATWKAFYNQYWPAIYLINKEGQIVYSHYGEGDYRETERQIQTLLAEPSPLEQTQ